MEEKATSFALEFDFKGSSQICVVDYDTEWIDVFAMVCTQVFCMTKYIQMLA